MANSLKFGGGQWATKEGSALAYNDENGNFKPLPFNFSRASNATVVNKDGLIETVGSGEPRIDFLGNTKGAMLLEPSRTNLITQSEAFSQSSWNKTNCTIISNNSISPNGTQNADKLIENNVINSFSNRYSTSVSYTSGLKYTISIFAKSDGRDLMIRSYNGSSDIDTIFDLSNGIILSGSSGEIKNYGNGWYRCSHTITAQSTINTVYSASFVLANGSSISYQGDGTSGVYIFGAQLEEGYATSYIKTEGSTVTRSQDVCNNGANEQVINSTEGVLYFEGSSIANDGTFKRISIGTSDNLFANSIQLRYNTSDNSITYQFRVGNVYQADLTITANTTNVNKIACVWKVNRFEIWVNGVKEAQDTSGSVPSSNTFNSLFFGKVSTSLTEPFKGSIKDIRVYNTALTDSELQALTQV